MRVLWVTNLFMEEGARDARGIFVTQQWDALRATGEVELELEIVAQGRGQADYLIANKRVRSHWDAGKFDLLHVHYGLTGLATLTLPASVPRVTTFYGSDVNSPRQRALSKLTARDSRRCIFVAQRLAAQIPSDRNVVLPNGVDFAQCAPAPRDEARAGLGLDPDAKLVLFGSRPENPVKGYDVFQDVLRRVRTDHPGVEELILSQPGQNYDGVVARLNAADCLLFTSRRGTEGSPTVIKEALAVGLPAVSVDVGDAREMLEGVEPGALIEWPKSEDDAEREAWIGAMASAVSHILSSGLRSDGRQKREFLRQDAIAQRTLEIYREAVG